MHATRVWPPQQQQQQFWPHTHTVCQRHTHTHVTTETWRKWDREWCSLCLSVREWGTLLGALLFTICVCASVQIYIYEMLECLLLYNQCIERNIYKNVHHTHTHTHPHCRHFSHKHTHTHRQKWELWWTHSLITHLSPHTKREKQPPYIPDTNNFAWLVGTSSTNNGGIQYTKSIFVKARGCDIAFSEYDSEATHKKRTFKQPTHAQYNTNCRARDDRPPFLNEHPQRTSYFTDKHDSSGWFCQPIIHLSTMTTIPLAISGIGHTHTTEAILGADPIRCRVRGLN